MQYFQPSLAEILFSWMWLPCPTPSSGAGHRGVLLLSPYTPQCSLFVPRVEVTLWGLFSGVLTPCWLHLQVVLPLCCLNAWVTCELRQTGNCTCCLTNLFVCLSWFRLLGPYFQWVGVYVHAHVHTPTVLTCYLYIHFTTRWMTRVTLAVIENLTSFVMDKCFESSTQCSKCVSAVLQTSEPVASCYSGALRNTHPCFHWFPSSGLLAQWH